MFIKRKDLRKLIEASIRPKNPIDYIDDETKDMLALLVFTLRDIANGIEESTLAWEKRNYWIKVEEFRNAWRWASELTGELEYMVVNGEWHTLPSLMVSLFPYYSDIKIIKFTRDSSLWQGCYNALMQDQP